MKIHAYFCYETFSNMKIKLVNIINKGGLSLVILLVISSIFIYKLNTYLNCKSKTTGCSMENNEQIKAKSLQKISLEKIKIIFL